MKKLFKQPQGRQGLNRRSLRLLVRTPSALEPELVYIFGGILSTLTDITRVLDVSSLSSIMFVY